MCVPCSLLSCPVAGKRANERAREWVSKKLGGVVCAYVRASGRAGEDPVRHLSVCLSVGRSVCMSVRSFLEQCPATDRRRDDDNGDDSQAT